MSSPAAMRGRNACLLLGRTVHDDALRADADGGAEHRAEGGRGPAESLCDLGFLGDGEPDAAISLRDRQAEEPEQAHLLDDFGRHLVGLVDLAFERHQPLAHKAVHLGQKPGKGLVINGRLLRRCLIVHGKVALFFWGS